MPEMADGTSFPFVDKTTQVSDDEANSKNLPRLKVAIIGGGPGGLAAAIGLAKLPFVDWELYEKKPRISETGGGLTLQPQTWRLLEQNGAAKNLAPSDFYRPPHGLIEERRNARTGQLLLQNFSQKDVPIQHQSCRLSRAKLQSALLSQVDRQHIHLSKKLVGLKQIPCTAPANNKDRACKLSNAANIGRRIRLSFEDGDEAEFDFVVAADGIRSVIRKLTFPNHNLAYNGQCVYRTIVSKAQVGSQIAGIPWAPVFWKHRSGLYVFTCPLGDDDFEVTARIRRPQQPAEPEPVSWGHPFDLQTLLHEYQDFCQPVQEILELAAATDTEKGKLAEEENGARFGTQEFALFSGPQRLDRMVGPHDNIAFVGDASHAMLGNFGAGAGFALEDVYALTKGLEWAWGGCSTQQQQQQQQQQQSKVASISRETTAAKTTTTELLAQALDFYDSVRSPHYRRLYEILDGFRDIKTALREEEKEMNLSVDDEIAERVRRISLASESWMYSYEIEKAVEEALPPGGSSTRAQSWAEHHDPTTYSTCFCIKSAAITSNQ